MMFDTTLKSMFSSFPRDVGDAGASFRERVYSNYQLKKFISKTNGVRDCFVAVYPDSCVIDKIFFDFDGRTLEEKEQALKEAQQLYQWGMEHHENCIPIATGSKGFHIHFLLDPETHYHPKEKLTNATYNIINHAFHIQDLHDESVRLTIDPQNIGDIRRLCRIPNTLRPPKNLSYCTYLPPERFLDMEWDDVVMHCKSTHTYNYELARKFPKLDELLSNVVIKPEFHQTKSIEMQVNNGGSKLLKGVLRPCLYNMVAVENPLDIVRVAVTLDLIELGFSDKTILKMFSHLNWRDWNEYITLDKIEYNRERFNKRKYNSFSCHKLEDLGLCHHECQHQNHESNIQNITY